MIQEIVIPYVRGKIADGRKRFDLDIVCRMVIEYDRVQAENEKLTERLEEWREQYATVISEACPPDEQHCTCVPMLRVDNERLRAALEVYADTTNWIQRPGCFDNDLWIMSEDGYVRARAALEKEGPKRAT